VKGSDRNLIWVSIPAIAWKNREKHENHSEGSLFLDVWTKIYFQDEARALGVRTPRSATRILDHLEYDERTKYETGLHFTVTLCLYVSCDSHTTKAMFYERGVNDWVVLWKGFAFSVS